MSWLVTVDHKRIGLMYLVATMFFFLVAGLLALALRTELLTPGQDYMSAQTYNQVFTLHGAIMVFLFIIPSIPASLGNFVLPLMLGAKDVAFPRLNLLSFHIYSSTPELGPKLSRLLKNQGELDKFVLDLTAEYIQKKEQHWSRKKLPICWRRNLKKKNLLIAS